MNVGKNDTALGILGLLGYLLVVAVSVVVDAIPLQVGWGLLAGVGVGIFLCLLWLLCDSFREWEPPYYRLMEVKRRWRIRWWPPTWPLERVAEDNGSEGLSPTIPTVAEPTVNRFREIVKCCRGPMDGTAKLLRKACEELRENEGGTDSLVAWLLTRDRGVIRRYEEVSARLNNTMPPPGGDVSHDEFQKLKTHFIEYHRRHYDLAQAHRRVMERLRGPEYFWLNDEYDSLRRAHLRCRDKLMEVRSHPELGGLLGAIHQQVGFVWKLFPGRDHRHRQELQALYDEGQRIREHWPSPEDDFEVQEEYADWVRRVAGFLDDNVRQGSVPAFGGRFVQRKILTLNANELRERLDDRMRRLDTIIHRLSGPSESHT